jgi:hypothetical protein
VTQCHCMVTSVGLVCVRETWSEIWKVTLGGKLKCPEEKRVVVPLCAALDFSHIEARNLRSESGE